MKIHCTPLEEVKRKELILQVRNVIEQHKGGKKPSNSGYKGNHRNMVSISQILCMFRLFYALSWG